MLSDTVLNHLTNFHLENFIATVTEYFKVIRFHQQEIKMLLILLKSASDTFQFRSKILVGNVK